jgi:hypothetical protein
LPDSDFGVCGKEKREKKIMKRISYMLFFSAVFACGCVRQEEAKTQQASLLPPVPATKLQAKAAATVQTALSDTTAYMRNHAIEISIETQQQYLMPEILKRLDDSSVAVRFTAAIAVGEMNCRTCQEQLKKSLEDKNENVRIAAAYAMIRLGEAAYYQRIRDAAVAADPAAAGQAWQQRRLGTDAQGHRKHRHHRQSPHAGRRIPRPTQRRGDLSLQTLAPVNQQVRR